MKTVLYMGISVNGNIARENGTVDWNSEEGWKSFYDQGKKAENFIMGAGTFRIAVEDGTFPFEGALNIVMTAQYVENIWGDMVMFTNEPPREVLGIVKQKGFETALLIGGGKLNSSFAKEKLIDEVYVDIEPIAFGKGIPLFESEEFEMKLRLLEAVQLNPNTIQIHYEVIK